MSRRTRSCMFDLMVAIALLETVAGITEFRPRKPAPVAEVTIQWARTSQPIDRIA